MNLYISVILRSEIYAEKFFSLLEEDGRLGLEIFPFCHAEGYMELLDRLLPRLGEFPVTFHEPYYDADHSYGKGSPEYQITMDHCKNILDRAAKLNAGYVVFHLNNREVPARTCPERDEMLENALANFAEMEEMASERGLKLLIENSGVPSWNNVLLGEDEFVNLFQNVGCGCLIDTGHANCNGWDLSSVIARLRHRIRSYHLHNNFGLIDDHFRIFDGTFGMAAFFEDYAKYTPDADIVFEYSPELMEGDIGWLKEDIASVRRMTSPVLA